MSLKHSFIRKSQTNVKHMDNWGLHNPLFNNQANRPFLTARNSIHRTENGRQFVVKFRTDMKYKLHRNIYCF